MQSPDHSVYAVHWGTRWKACGSLTLHLFSWWLMQFTTSNGQKIAGNHMWEIFLCNVSDFFRTSWILKWCIVALSLDVTQQDFHPSINQWDAGGGLVICVHTGVSVKTDALKGTCVEICIQGGIPWQGFSVLAEIGIFCLSNSLLLFPLNFLHCGFCGVMNLNLSFSSSNHLDSD